MNTTTTVGTGCTPSKVEGTDITVMHHPVEPVTAAQVEQGDILMFRGHKAEKVVGEVVLSGGKVIFPTRRLETGEARTGIASFHTAILKRACACTEA